MFGKLKHIRILFVLTLCLSLLAFIPFAMHALQTIRSDISQTKNNQALSGIIEDYTLFKKAMLAAINQPSPILVEQVQKKLVSLELSLHAGFTGIYDVGDNAAYVSILQDMRREVNAMHSAVFASDFLTAGDLPVMSASLVQALTSMHTIENLLLDNNLYTRHRAGVSGFDSHAAHGHSSFYFGVIMACMFLGLLIYALRFAWLKFTDVKALHTRNIEATRDIAALQKAMMAAQDGVVLLDPSGCVTFMNSAAKSMLHVKSEHLKSCDLFFWRDIFDQQTQDKINTNIDPSLQYRGQWSGAFEGQASAGQAFDLHVSISRVPDSGYLVLLNDNAAAKKQEREVDDLRLQYYQAQKMEAVGRMAGGIAHDFNNILAAISGYAQFLLHDLPRQSDTRQFADKILAASHQAQNLVEQLLSFSRRGDVRRDSVDMLALLHDVASMVRASAPPSVHVHVSISPHLQNICLHGQSTQISQVLMNICLNAVDAMADQGHLKLALDMADMLQVFPAQHCIQANDLAPDVPPLNFKQTGPDSAILTIGSYSPMNQYCCIHIADTGSGIQPAIMQQIFEPFFTTKDQDKGTGLGLASAHGIMLSHQGLMQVESVVGKGTIFRLYFLILNADIAQKDMPHVHMRADHLAEHEDDVQLNMDDWPIDLPVVTKGSAKQARVLVVDDQSEVRAMLCLMLERGGYMVFDCASATEALSLLKDSSDIVDVILTDYAMPDMTGIVFAEAVHDLAPAIPIILISGYQAEEMNATTLAAHHIVALVQKPVQAETLHSVIRGALENAR